MKKANFKTLLPDVLAVVIFVCISFLYFFPSDIEGRILYQHDASAGKGAGVESSVYHKRTGEVTRWTGALFSGMPTYQMSPTYTSMQMLQTVEDAYHLWLPTYVWYLFASLLGFYILLRAFDFRQYMAVLGAIIWAFSSYFLIIIAAGHIWKVMTLLYIPPTIAGMVIAYRGRYLKGGVLTALFVALQVRSNHVQMSYYFLIVMLFMFIAYLIEAAKKKDWKPFLKSTLTCIVAGVIGISINISNLYHTYQYSKESMRGKSELVAQNKNEDSQISSGLSREYITQWSYGIGETWTLLIPNYMGGASVPLSLNEKAMLKADSNFEPLYHQLTQYWGEQPGTSGPVYVGAFVMFLFILSLFVLRSPMKWALLAATILSVMLSWGRNMMWFTDIFIDWVPMYSKFRTVSSILVVAEFTIPLLAMLGLKEIAFPSEDFSKKRFKVGLVVSILLTIVPCMLLWAIPSLAGDFISTGEMSALQANIPQEYLAPLCESLRKMRQAMLSADASRSMLIILVGVVLLLLMKAKKMKTTYAVIFMTIVCLIDMWQVDKRYLHDDMFVSTYERDAPQPKTPADEEILKDKTLDYRVLNFTVSTFNDNTTSYYHKSIGGYHAAKLGRYNDLINTHIQSEMQNLLSNIALIPNQMAQLTDSTISPVLNMLNTKYFIVSTQQGLAQPVLNPYAQGAAWFVDDVRYAKNANEEISLLSKIDLKHIAVADERFAPQLGDVKCRDRKRSVSLVEYEPNHLTYDVHAGKDGGILVFSEIYYPGWKATIDGQDVAISRVNYVLRAININGGNHKVELSFFPKSIDTTETIAYVGLIVLVLAVIWLVVANIRKKDKPQEV